MSGMALHNPWHLESCVKQKEVSTCSFDLDTFQKRIYQECRHNNKYINYLCVEQEEEQLPKTYCCLITGKQPRTTVQGAVKTYSMDTTQQGTKKGK